ncbi:MAG: hypothetical protein KJ737_03135 [Proteobacteria bacterium]|nr:hypothetical protein [Pseudomonadota bacterium]
MVEKHTLFTDKILDFPESELGVCWIYGKERNVYLKEEKCAEKLKEEGIEILSDDKGAIWIVERYGCPRFTTPDDKGNIILDICYFVK